MVVPLKRLGIPACSCTWPLCASSFSIASVTCGGRPVSAVQNGACSYLTLVLHELWVSSTAADFTAGFLICVLQAGSDGDTSTAVP